jgi:hypothetical protein
MNTRKSVYTKLFTEKTELGTHQIELGLIQDITKDLNTVSDSLVSIRPALMKIEDLLIKNSKAVDLANKAIQRVESTAKELGADNLIKELEKPKSLVNNFNNTINTVLKAVQNGVAQL